MEKLMIRFTMRQVMLVLFALTQLLMTIGPASSASFSSLSDVEKAAYALPDGTLPVFCDPSVDGSGLASHGICEGCCCTYSGQAVFRVRTHPLYLFSARILYPDDHLYGDNRDGRSRARAPPSV